MNRALLVDDLPEALAMIEGAVRAAFPGAACQQATGVREALEAIGRVRFDLALVDLTMADGSGIEVITALALRQPGCMVVVATIHDDDDHLFEALQAGAQGYLLKDHPGDWMARQLRGVVEGQPPLSPAIARRLLRHFRTPGSAEPPSAPGTTEALSAREREVLALLAHGERLADIAGRLGISRHTVGDHVKSIYRKLNITSRAEAALRARGMGLA